MQEKTIEELVTEIQAGEHSLMGELCERLRRYITKTAYSLHAGDMTEDLIQEGFLSLYTAAGRSV